MDNKKAKVEQKLDLLEQELKCVICLSVFDDPHSLPCNHQFCFECIAESVRLKSQCPLCKLPAFHRAIQKNQALGSIVTAYNNLKDALHDFSVDNGIRLQIPTSPATPTRQKSSEPLKRPSSEDESCSSNGNHNTANKTKRQCRQPTPITPVQRDVFISPSLPPYVPPAQPPISRRRTQQNTPYLPPPTTPTTIQTAPGLPVSKCKKFVLLTTSLDEKAQAMVKQLVNTLNGTLVDKYTRNVTHIITTCNNEQLARRTLKYCFAVVEGKWAVSFAWVRRCLEEDCWLAEDEFEIKGDQTAIGAPRLSRLNKDERLPDLFEDYRIYLYGDITSPSKEEMKKLLVLGGADVCTSMPRNNNHSTSNEVIVCDSNYIDELDGNALAVLRKTGLAIADYGWVLDSVSHYKVLPLMNYVVELS